MEDNFMQQILQYIAVKNDDNGRIVQIFKSSHSLEDALRLQEQGYSIYKPITLVNDIIEIK